MEARALSRQRGADTAQETLRERLHIHVLGQRSDQLLELFELSAVTAWGVNADLDIAPLKLLLEGPISVESTV